MAPQPDLRSQPSCDPEAGCITCGDVGIPMRILEIDTPRELALCADGHDRRSTVEIALVRPVAVGDALLVHAGTAITKLSGEAGPA
jgi:hydrogenase expression/formation protein HypC